LTLKSFLDGATASLQGFVDTPRREAMLLLMYALDVDELYIMMHTDEIIQSDIQAFLDEGVAKLQSGVPLEYITNRVSFYSQEFYVDEGALIPRPETELLIDEIKKYFHKDAKLNIVEVGVGSGIISIVLAQHFKNAHFKAIDISEKALLVAKKNRDVFDLQERIELHEGSFLEPIGMDEQIDILVSNPPYIANDVDLDKKLSYEPQNALFGGVEGDEMVRVLLDEVHKREIPFFACEFGYDQKSKVQNYLQDKNYKNLAFYKDYADFDRGFIYEL